MTTTIFIADACKAGLVMTSEACKDKISGAIILHAPTGSSMLEHFYALKKNDPRPDLCVVDFDLPDTDGITLVQELRKVFTGPIFLTAYPDRIAREAIEKELYTHDDVGVWLKKPIKAEDIHQKIETYLIKKHRLLRRKETDLQAEVMFAKGTAKVMAPQKKKITGPKKAAAPKSAAPKNTLNGKIVNVSITGACLELNLTTRPVKNGETLTIKAQGLAGKNADVLQGKVTWSDRKSNLVGIRFEKMNDAHKNAVDKFLREGKTRES